MDMDVDFLGEAWDEPRFEGLGLDSKAGELNNLVFAGFDKEGKNLVFEKDRSMQNQEEKTKNWDDKQYLEGMNQDLLEFSRVSNLEGIGTFAKKWGPLFGTRGYDGSKCVESLDMWWAAIYFFKIGFRLKAEEDSKDEDRKLYKKVKIALELTPEQKKQQREDGRSLTLEEKQEYALLLKICLKCFPDDYQKFVLDKDCCDYGYWREQRWDCPTATERKLLQTNASREFSGYEEIPKDLIETQEDTVPSLTVGIHLNPRPANCLIGKKSDIEYVDLDDVSTLPFKDISGKLCRNALEALISMHTRNVQYSWLQHQFKPIFREHIRYLWFTFSVYRAQGRLAYCKCCSTPYWKIPITKKYCTPTCRRDANKKRKSSGLTSAQ